MLTQESVQDFTKKFQTSEKNIIREYVQHLFLSSLYKTKEAGKLLFKGGTALRFVFQSPRFSEDMDFTGKGVRKIREIDTPFLSALAELEMAGLDVQLEEAKETSGGYLGIIRYKLFDVSEGIKFEVSLRKASKTHGEATSIVSDFTTPYSLIHISAPELVSGKIEALLFRRKPRDYYDLYFMLRHPALNRIVNKDMLHSVLGFLDNEKIDFKRELSILLPVSHHLVLKNFKENLRSEIGKYIRK